MNAKQLERIRQHGNDLLAIFPNATEKDPVALCKKLRKLESQGQAIALRLCNGPAFPGGDDAVDRRCEVIIDKVNVILGNWKVLDDGTGRLMIVPIKLNRDPRGYALKIREEWMIANRPKLERDWGGYGILAPEIK